MQWKNIIVDRWREKEFRRSFFFAASFYIASPIIDFIIGLSTIGFVASIVTLILFITIARGIYKEKEALRTGAVKSLWVLFAIYILLLLFGVDIIGVLIKDSILTMVGLTLAIMTFWIIFFNFWTQELKLTHRIFAYITALSVSNVLFALVTIFLLFWVSI